MFRNKHNGSYNLDIVSNKGLIIPAEYTEQTIETLPSYIEKNCPHVMNALEASVGSDLKAVEMGDGNLNLVFIIRNSINDKKIIVKQVSGSNIITHLYSYICAHLK